MFDRLLSDSFIIFSNSRHLLTRSLPFLASLVFTSSPSLPPLAPFISIFPFSFPPFVTRFICPTPGLQVIQPPPLGLPSTRSGSSKGDHHILEDAWSHPAWSIPL
ncbi:hypothetical protein BDQ94DRAFT_13312 [Aspergillus welwitschiae]|uniref:Uncharacterized protein n=1 Tax=Aspergillus welwitschiae TaxID=1341132 RepID=A0A3F3PHY4_9EURO|nr:hypothetical protein BDQ94DRAFT_13312 [Aspergillus welwitschiae]RDH26571.1 hypothetical protein BDQ94DRAFT_13312 [Aspergillus welwitschiae]